MSERNDIWFMRRAFELARKGWGTTHPNPMVGVVIADKGEIIGEGFHEKAGEPHAEIHALRSLLRSPSSEATLYATMEPCSSQGRTPPCTKAILESGLKRVVVGAVDPNPLHRGRGIEILREAGVEVSSGVLKEECEDLNLIFNHWMGRGEPFFAAKTAATLDGRVATRARRSKWITGEKARGDVMRWRRLFPAVAVGAGTVQADNPRLTSRSSGGEWCPLRFIFDTRLRTLQNGLSKVYSDSFKDRTIVVCGDAVEHGGRERLEEAGIRDWSLPLHEGHVSLSAFRKKCAQSGITGVFFEGGPTLWSSLLAERLLDYLFAYRAPVLLADEKALPAFKGLSPFEIASGFKLTQVRHSFFDSDQLMRGFLVYPE